MKKRYPIAIAAFVVVLLLAWAVFRGQGSRELILKRNGLPLANLAADVLPNVGGVDTIRTSTDVNGRLDLTVLPGRTQCIRLELRDGTNIVLTNHYITLPENGSLTIDFRGKQTICTTKRTYAFGLPAVFSVGKKVSHVLST